MSDNKAAPIAPPWPVEFPTYGGTLGIEVAPGWTETSWHNDICPSFSYEVTVGDSVYAYRLWVDYPLAEQRAMQDLKRYRLSLHKGETNEGICDVYETDDPIGMAAMVSLIALRNEVLDWQAALGGERDGLDDLCSFIDGITDPVDVLADPDEGAAS